MRITLVTQVELTVDADDLADAIDKAIDHGPTFDVEAGFGVEYLCRSDYEEAHE